MLIVFEGLDQSGKETQARALGAHLEALGHRVRALSFPDYQTPIGSEIRHALDGERDFDADVMQLLYVANRLEWRRQLTEWLEDGEVVICDRFRASTVAYGEAQGLDPHWLEQIQRTLPKPAITLFLDIAPETAVVRKSTGRDRYERDLDLLSRVRLSYNRQAASPDWIVINGEGQKADVSTAIIAAVTPRLSQPSAPARP